MFSWVALTDVLLPDADQAVIAALKSYG